jgi:hypothetical protein
MRAIEPRDDSGTASFAGGARGDRIATTHGGMTLTVTGTLAQSNDDPGFCQSECCRMPGGLVRELGLTAPRPR